MKWQENHEIGGASKSRKIEWTIYRRQDEEIKEREKKHALTRLKDLSPELAKREK